MNDVFSLLKPPADDVFFSRHDRNDPRMGELVGRDPRHYEFADIVILGCPQDEGIRRNGGREGAAKAPDAIRRQFFRLTTMNIRRRIVDIGDLDTGGTLEETHERHAQVVKKVLEDGKRLIVIGGGNDLSYPDGNAMAAVYGVENWLAVNVNSRLDVRKDEQPNSGTAYRQLLEEKLLLPGQLFEVGYQSHFCSPLDFEYVRSLGVERISLEQLRSKAIVDEELKERIKQNFIHHSSSLNVLFGFDLNAVRAADAPGTSAPSPLGLRAGEFVQLVKYASSLANTRMVEFTEVNPDYDVDDRTTRLVAIAMHRFCTGVA